MERLAFNGRQVICFSETGSSERVSFDVCRDRCNIEVYVEGIGSSIEVRVAC